MGKATTMLALAVLALALLAAVASARPIAFVGGSFTQVRGHFSPRFGAFTEDGDQTGWARLESTAVHFNGPIVDMFPVGEGVFAVGSFSEIAPGVASSAIAFYDGHKWCSIRETPAGSASAVWCDSDTSCWVAGSFSSLNNVPDDINVEFVNFAHYTFDDVANEWLWDPSQRAWNNNTASNIATLDNNAVPGTLIGLRNQTDNNTYFFVGVGSLGAMRVKRGSPGDEGWRDIAQPAGPDTSQVRDFGFDTTVYPPIWYSLNQGTTSADNEGSTPWLQDNLLAPCTHINCDSFVVQAAFVSFAFVPRQQSQNFIREYSSIWAKNGTRYLVALFDPDGTALTRQPRWQVMKQTGEDDPLPLGLPFTTDTANELTLVRGHPLNSEWAYVIGTFEGANLFFPQGDSEDSVTTDVSTDRRSADRINYVAAWRELGRWEPAFGGGFLTFEGGSPSAASFPIVFNHASQQWFVANADMTYVYDVVANGAAWYDNAEDPAQPSVFPVFTRGLWRRPNQFDAGISPGNQIGVVPANVFDFICYTNCEYVYVAGDFNFHGNDTIGGIALVEVEQEGEASPQTVGGGLWYNDLNVVRDNPDLQFTSGAVYALAREGDFLYAGGFFSRGKTGYVCLSNVARIRNSAAVDSETQWEDLGGGCDNEVYDLHIWEGRLYAAGLFQWCGNRKVNYVADYTYLSGSNAEWSNLNNGVDGVAYSIEAFGGRLIFAGEFSYAGGLPVTGVAAWNKEHWRPLLPSCTQDCVPGSLQYYFNVLNSPNQVFNLKAAKDGNFLYARASFGDAGSSSASSLSSSATTNTHLARWEYFDDSDLGIWTVKGPQAEFTLTAYHKRADGVFVNNGTYVLVGGTANDAGLTRTNQDLHTWDDHSAVQNWIGTHLVFAPEVFVVRSSASSLSSPLAFLLSSF